MRKPYRGIRGKGNNPIVAGRQFCLDCGRWRSIADFSCHSREPLRLKAQCRACSRLERRALMRYESVREVQRQRSLKYNRRRRREMGATPLSELGPNHKVVCGRKHCRKCGRWRPVSDFRAKRYKNKPDYLGLTSLCEACLRADNREVRKRRSADLVRAERHREYDRMWKTDARRRKGVPPRNWRKDRLPREAHKGWTVEPGPLAMEIQRMMRRGVSEAELARASGVPERRIYGVLHGERISIPKADALVVAMGLHLDLLYPDEVAA